MLGRVFEGCEEARGLESAIYLGDDSRNFRWDNAT